MRGSAQLELGYTPPSLNRMATRGNRFAVRSAKRSLQNDLTLMLLAERVPEPLTLVKASAELRFAQRRRRDPGNFSWLLEKALGDALAPHDTNAPHRWLPDDTAEYFVFCAPVTIAADPGRPYTRVSLTWEA